jgi:hypothetical protein
LSRCHFRKPLFRLKHAGRSNANTYTWANYGALVQDSLLAIIGQAWEQACVKA